MPNGRKSKHWDDAILLLNKGKRGILRIVFSRTMVIILLLALQVLFLFSAFFRLLGDNLALIFTGSGVISTIMAVVIVNDHRQNPSIKLTWSVLIIIFPIFAIPFYFFVKGLWINFVHFKIPIQKVFLIKKWCNFGKNMV